jgi:hypothetical protein
VEAEPPQDEPLLELEGEELTDADIAELLGLDVGLESDDEGGEEELGNVYEVDDGEGHVETIFLTPASPSTPQSPEVSAALSPAPSPAGEDVDDGVDGEVSDARERAWRLARFTVLSALADTLTREEQQRAALSVERACESARRFVSQQREGAAEWEKESRDASVMEELMARGELTQQSKAFLFALRSKLKEAGQRMVRRVGNFGDSRVCAMKASLLEEAAEQWGALIGEVLTEVDERCLDRNAWEFVAAWLVAGEMRRRGLWVAEEAEEAGEAASLAAVGGEGEGEGDASAESGGQFKGELEDTLFSPPRRRRTVRGRGLATREDAMETKGGPSRGDGSDEHIKELEGSTEADDVERSSLNGDQQPAPASEASPALSSARQPDAPTAVTPSALRMELSAGSLPPLLSARGRAPRAALLPSAGVVSPPLAPRAANGTGEEDAVREPAAIDSERELGDEKSPVMSLGQGFKDSLGEGLEGGPKDRVAAGESSEAEAGVRVSAVWAAVSRLDPDDVDALISEAMRYVLGHCGILFVSRDSKLRYLRLKCPVNT